MGEKLVGEISGAGQKLPHQSLSNREYQIFQMMIAGKALKEIAGKLSLAPTTISSYRTRILDKLNAKTNAELIRYALEHGLFK